MKTSVATSRRSDSADGSFAPFTRASFAWPWRSVTASSSGAPFRVPSATHARSRLAEADQLRVLARARREPLRHDVQRLEQVRLADTVAADDEHDPRLECEVERRV